mmetsp:Transcript_3811/g.10732  ORF Transcript_3811/g.10732 Transcript_3811/m.10732 type:complete len:210 (-) Transcript_3811:409-1038(-)
MRVRWTPGRGCDVATRVRKIPARADSLSARCSRSFGFPGRRASIPSAVSTSLPHHLFGNTPSRSFPITSSTRWEAWDCRLREKIHRPRIVLTSRALSSSTVNCPSNTRTAVDHHKDSYSGSLSRLWSSAPSPELTTYTRASSLMRRIAAQFSSRHHPRALYVSRLHTAPVSACTLSGATTRKVDAVAAYRASDCMESSLRPSHLCGMER